MRDTDLAYLAGLIDGEGCIAIEKYSIIEGYKSPRYTLKVEIQMSEYPSIAYLSEVFSRPIMVKRPSANAIKTAYRISWQSHLAEKLLEQLLPYLKGKRLQAEIAIAFQKAVRLPRDGQSLSANELQIREDAYLRLRSLKRPTITLS